MYYNLLDIVYGISCFQLVIFSFFLIHKGRKSISNLILAAFFLTQFVVISNFLLVGLSEYGSHFHLQIAYIFYPFEYLWGPLLYFYIRSQVKANFRFRFANFVHLIPFILVTGFIISYYYDSDMATKLSIVNNKLIYQWLNYFNIPFNLLLFSYNFYALYLVIKVEQEQKNYSSFVVKRNLDWLKFVMYCYIVVSMSTAIINFTHQIISIPTHIILLILFVPFLVFISVLFYKALLNPYVLFVPEEKPKQSLPGIGNAEMQDYAKSIEAFIKSEKPHLNPVLTLRDLSKATGTSERIISTVINSYWNQNFFSFINTYRVEEAKILLQGFDQKKSTMLGISFDAGFNSKSAFYDAFKKQTGMTPREYRILKA